MITSQTNLTKLDPCWGPFLVGCIYSVQLTDWQQRKRERTCVWGVRSGIHSIFGTGSQGLPTTWGYSSLRRCVSESWPPASPRTCVAKAGPQMEQENRTVYGFLSVEAVHSYHFKWNDSFAYWFPHFGVRVWHWKGDQFAELRTPVDA